LSLLSTYKLIYMTAISESLNEVISKSSIKIHFYKLQAHQKWNWVFKGDTN
jgi:hypothetical protein